MKLVVKTVLLLFILTILNGASVPVASAQEPVPVLAFYYAWFDQNTWESGQAVDLPAQRYVSADPATIAQHVTQAQSAGIDALVQSWYGPQVENNQTETNFHTLLEVSQGKGFKAAVDFETQSPFLGDAAAVTQALSTLLATHAQHPAYLRYQGKPVIFFWRQQRFSVDEWRTIRAAIDPDHTSYWIAEGIDLAYQDVFDGHHLYSIAWAESPAAQLAKWGKRVRTYESENQTKRLWVATTMPGYDDTHLPRADAFNVARRNGDYYRETWQGAVDSQAEMIIITSFNEWLEGTHIEPSASYGNFYLELTRELVTNLRGVAPATAPPAQVVQQIQSTEVEPTTPAAETSAAVQEPPLEEPYVQIENITNVRSGPATTFDILGRLDAGSLVAVVGRLEGNDWWLIEYEGGVEGQGWVAAEVVEFVGDAASVPVVEAPAAVEVSEESDGSSTTDGDTSNEVEDDSAVEAGNNKTVIVASVGEVNVRSGPGLNFDLLGRLAQGSEAPVVAQDSSGDWWQIEYEAAENGLAWVADAVVDFYGERGTVPLAANSDPDVTPSPTPTPEPLIVGQVEATDPINVRSEPSLEGLLLGGLYSGETADVLAVSEDGEWWQIDFAAAPGEPAWVSAEFVRFTGEELSIPIFGIGTVTPTPGPTDTPTATPSPTATPTIQAKQPTFAPTATSIYQATSEALLSDHDPVEPVTNEPSSTFSFSWSTLPWGILAILLVIGFIWYQFGYRRRR